ncbi:ImmA/IrrE family metallo-endopeptidase [Fructobacillus sp. M1-13]|uniref:ImmA/IrrE family metallo-endopeptidase n=1 Tax=Fructobacillus papyriferae TaxID=2713171 RepID=A0ABS5QQ75_9LACO|nr:ImmA/IrrE family metallo-endopeptidase [Fructobacillus papyriferae]MBS9334982.1 ImmA/IrrE family metallo-endopeptidase [Fructobacillus papyriferae]MCD2159534.1 ImmA/IrrE family metallo-endopeptidase [Fructobacillus papyriferae]
MSNYEEVIKKADSYSKIFQTKYMGSKDLSQYALSMQADSFANVVIDEIGHVDFFKFNNEDLLGFAFSDEYESTIVINERLHYKNQDVRLGFTIAHEIGHVVLGHPISKTFTISESLYDETNHYEFEANTFAANLLLPFNVFCRQINKGFHLKQISAASKISKSVVTNRIKSILSRRFLLSEEDVNFIYEEYAQCNNKYSVKKSMLHRMLDQYNMLYSVQQQSSLYVRLQQFGNTIANDVLHFHNSIYNQEELA